MKSNLRFLYTVISALAGISIIYFMAGYGSVERYAIIFISLFLFYIILQCRSLNFILIMHLIVGLGIGLLIGCYSLAFFRYDDNLKKETINIDQNGNTAVLLIFNGEPITYDLPIQLNNHLRSIKFHKRLQLPLKLYQNKRAYERIGVSKYKETSLLIEQRLKKLFTEYYDLYIAYRNDIPYYYQVMGTKLYKENYEKIIVVPVFLTESDEYKKIVNALSIQQLNFKTSKVKYMVPLWNSEKMVKLIVKKVDDALEDYHPSDVGIILLGTYISNSEDKSPSGKKEEYLFMESVKSVLTDRGFDERKIKLDDTYLREQDINGKIEEMQEYGVGRVILVYVGDICDTIENQDRLERMITSLEIDTDVDIHYISGWGDNQLLVDELEYRIRLMNVESWND
ncbi:MAG: hypothetical protein ACOYVK_01610 [Bacillota bacterium]